MDEVLLDKTFFTSANFYRLLTFLRMKSLPPFMADFCLKMVMQTVKNREIIRKDLMQYLIELRNNSAHEIDDKKGMSYEQIAGQVFVFYIAGNESSSSTIAYTIYELTQDDDLMLRALEDIQGALNKHDGQLTYESVMDMQFIDLCVKETLRKYPFPILNRQEQLTKSNVNFLFLFLFFRECTKDYQIPGSKTIIRKGTPIIISVLGIHRDEQFFPAPLTYDPDRFTAEKHAFNEDMYMPFGLGPRNCIAFRMGLLVSKVAIVKMLMNFKIDKVSKRELEFDFGTVGLLPKIGQCKIKLGEKFA